MTIAQVKAANKSAGNYFFEPSTMKFFGSRIESSVYKNNTFITSEWTDFERRNRAYTVRVFNESNGSVTTANFPNGESTFNKFRTIDAARDFCKSYQN